MGEDKADTLREYTVKDLMDALATCNPTAKILVSVEEDPRFPVLEAPLSNIMEMNDLVELQGFIEK